MDISAILQSLVGTQPQADLSGIGGMAQSAPSIPHPGFLAPGSKGAMIAGIIGDMLSTAGGGRSEFIPAALAQRQQQQEDARWTNRQQSELQNQMALKRYELDNRPPPAPSEYERMLEASGVQRGTPQWAQHMGQRANSMENPVTPMQATDANGNPAVAYVPRNPPPQSAPTGGPPPHVIDYLRQHPETRDQFEQKYGSGAAAQYLGGAATSATPPFGDSKLDRITMNAESGGNPNAVSPMGARGLMQVMPSTARDPGFGIRPSNGTPADDVRVGQEYRAAMQQRYSGDPAKMWAAYNAGPGRVDHALAAGPNWLSAMPAETQRYVQSNLRQLRGR